MNLWSRVDELLDRSNDPAGLEAHGLDLLAAQRWRAVGRSIPDGFLIHERVAVMATLAVPSVLRRIRDVLDGPILLLKGPEVAARYPDAALRPFCDLDLVVRDPDEAQSRLIAAGWEEMPVTAPHHRPTLEHPGTLLAVEIHARPNWPRWTTANVDDLFSARIPSRIEVDGIDTLPSSYHAVLLAAHSWQHEPFRRFLDLLDVAVMSDEVDEELLDQIAERWGLGHVWRATNRAIYALYRGTPPASLVDRIITSHCRQLRERNVIESRLASWIAGCWAPTPLAIAGALSSTFYDDLRPYPGESWSRKIRRTGVVARHALRPNSQCPRS